MARSVIRSLAELQRIPAHERRALPTISGTAAFETWTSQRDEKIAIGLGAGGRHSWVATPNTADRIEIEAAMRARFPAVGIPRITRKTVPSPRSLIARNILRR